MLRRLRTCWPAVSWLLALVLLTAAFPVHQHGQVPVSSAIESPVSAGDIQPQAPCAACRLLQTPALEPAPAARPGADLALMVAAPPLSAPTARSPELSPAAPRGPPALI